MDPEEHESTTIPVDGKDDADDKFDKKPTETDRHQGGTDKEGTEPRRKQPPP